MQNSPLSKDFYKHSLSEPISLEQNAINDNPIILVNGRPHKMISALEFLERLHASKTSERLKHRLGTNEQETTLRERLTKRIKTRIQQGKYHPTFWNDGKAIIRDGKTDEEIQGQDEKARGHSYLVTAKDEVFRRVEKV